MAISRTHVRSRPVQVPLVIVLGTAALQKWLAANTRTESRIGRDMSVDKVIVIGASAGGVEALKDLVPQFPENLPVPIFITLHLFNRSETILPEILRSAGPLPVKHPSRDEPTLPGHIYVAPPDRHLILSPGSVTLGHGPKENLQRPCINVMFRSAAEAYGPNAIGVLLTGMLDDGASGLWEIKKRGGVAVVQDPQEAAYASMPVSAIRGFGVDHILRIRQMGPLLEHLVSGGAKVNGRENVSESPSSPDDSQCHQSCPECGGVMTEWRHGLLYEYHCHIGHRFGLKTMIAEKTELVERMLSGANAQTEELIELLTRAQPSSDPAVSASIAQEIESCREQVRTLRQLMESRISATLGS